MIRNENQNIILKGEFALERENIRVNLDGKMSTTKHPEVFGSKNLNKYIKADFAESQIELITPICDSVNEVYNFLENLQKVVALNIENEYLWPQSNPPILPENPDEILVAQYGNEDTIYREYLAKKYGSKRSTFSGIHFNFSFPEDTLAFLCKKLNIHIDKSYNIYMKTLKYLTKYNWLFIYLTGASPVFHESFKSDNDEIKETKFHSFRNSNYGYKNLKNFILNYNSIEEYNNSIEKLIKCGEIDRASELYVPIRIKNSYRLDKKDKSKYYLELRFIDLNPLYKVGVNKEDLEMLHLLIIYFALCNDFDFTEEMQERAYYNIGQVAAYGKTKIINDKGNYVNMEDEALILIDNLKKCSDIGNNYNYTLKSMIEKIKDITITYSFLISQEIEEKGYINYHMNKAKNYLQKDTDTEFRLEGYDDLELSTQCLLQSILKKGLSFKVLDRLQNFIYVEHEGKVEYIKEATKTSVDNYSTILVMENKHITKFVLDKNKVKTPKGVALQSLEEGIIYYDKIKDTNIVVKPNNTNFGKGITILKSIYNFENYKVALERAFKEDNVVLVEEFMEGNEYRFLVIGDKIEAILHRRAANVVGDGKSTIKELIEIKNNNPLRSIGYTTPLEKIIAGEIELEFLQKQGLDFESIPNKDERIFLRQNSNISTGGDSIDFTDNVHFSYSQIALDAAKCVGAKLCGVDMIIRDTNIEAKDNYCIIELNFNPAIQMHCFPYSGTKRKIGDKILSLLFNLE